MKTPLSYSSYWTERGPAKVGAPSVEFWKDWKREQAVMVGSGLSLGPYNHRIQDYELHFTPPAPVLTDLPQWIKERLRDYQVPAVQGLVAGMGKGDRVLDASETGLGKTYSSLAAIATRGRAPFVVCRRAALPAWKEVGKLFGFDLKVGDNLINWESLRVGKTAHAAEWADEKGRNGRTYRRFKWHLSPAEHDLIFDEVHQARAPDGTLNSKMHIASTAAGMSSLNLSATAANEPIHFRALGYALGLHNLDNFYPWLFRLGYCQGQYGLEWLCDMTAGERFKRVGGQWVEKPEAAAELARRRQGHLAEIHRQIFTEGRGVRLRKRDIANFPKTLIVPKLFSFGTATAAIQKAYRELQTKLASQEGRTNRLAILVAESVGIERLKMPTIGEEIRDAINEGLSVAVFVNYVESAQYLCSILKTQCCVVGGQPDKVRAANIANFQANRERVIICNVSAGGESISLHDQTGEHPRCSFVMPSYFAERILQAFGRIDRDGVREVTTQIVPFAADTVEEAQWQNFLTKSDNLETLNDGVMQQFLEV